MSTFERVRIAQVCPYSLSVPGGVQGQVLSLAAALRRLGHDAMVLAPCDGPPPGAAVVPLGRSVPLAANGSVAPVSPDPACALRTLAALGQEGFDVAHVHEPLVPGPSLTTLLGADLPMVGTFHRSGPSLAYHLLRPLVTRVADRLDVRCAVSEEARATAVGALGGNCVVVPNGVDVEGLGRARPAPTGGPTIVFIGRHEPRKGLEVLIRAFSRLPGPVRLWVVGAGPETAGLRRQAAGQDRIEWLGQVSDEAKACLLRGADVYVAPSLGGESFGVVLLEAMAAGTAIVASDLAAYRAVASPELEAILVPPGDPGALAAALVRVLTEPGLASRLVEAGRSRVARFSMEGVAGRYLDLYAEAIARRQSRSRRVVATAGSLAPDRGRAPL